MAVIFLVAEGVKPSKILTRMFTEQAKCSFNRAYDYKYEYVDRFKKVNDELLCGSPVKV